MFKPEPLDTPERVLWVSGKACASPGRLGNALAWAVQNGHEAIAARLPSGD